MFLNDAVASGAITHLGARERKRWSGVCCLVQLPTQELTPWWLLEAPSNFPVSLLASLLSSLALFFFLLIYSLVFFPSLWLKRRKGGWNTPMRGVWTLTLIPSCLNLVSNDGTVRRLVGLGLGAPKTVVLEVKVEAKGPHRRNTDV